MQIIERIRSSARSGCCPETRFALSETDLGYGEFIAQGDVMIERRPLDDPIVNQLGEEAPRQLVGGSEIGSRHVVRPGPSVRARKGATALQGPVIIAPEGFYLEHPKHADWDVRLPGAYVVTFQQDLTAEELRARRD